MSVEAKAVPQWTLCTEHGTGPIHRGSCTICIGDRNLIQVVPAEALAQARAEVESLQDDRKRAPKVAYAQSLETQTYVAAMIDMVRTARAERDKARAEADAAKREYALGVEVHETVIAELRAEVERLTRELAEVTRERDTFHAIITENDE